jgi:hypothetical protein
MKTLLGPHLRELAPITIADHIRLGVKSDGGYVIPQSCLKDSRALLSLGLGDDWSFDRDWRYHKPQDIIHSYDGTIDPDSMPAAVQRDYSIFWREPCVHFPVNIGHDQLPNQRSFRHAMRALGSDCIFVKIDIEGGEWQLIQDLTAYHAMITGIVMEIHDVGRLREMFLDSVRSLNQHFFITHIHGNNSCGDCEDGLPQVIEISWANRHYLPDPAIPRYDIYLPGLDYPNLRFHPDPEMFFDLNESS